MAEFVTANLNGTSSSDFSSFLYLSVNMLDPSSGSYRLFRITIFLALSNHCYIFDRIFLQSLENSQGRVAICNENFHERSEALPRLVNFSAILHYIEPGIIFQLSRDC